MVAVRARVLPPLLRHFVDVVGELNPVETAPALVPSKVVSETARALPKIVKAR